MVDVGRPRRRGRLRPPHRRRSPRRARLRRHPGRAVDQRRGGLRRAGQDHRTAPERGRLGHVRGQGDRQEPGRGVPGLHAVADARTARSDQRVPLGARTLRVLPRVPADRLPGRRSAAWASRPWSAGTIPTSARSSPSGSSPSPRRPDSSCPWGGGCWSRRANSWPPGAPSPGSSLTLSVNLSRRQLISPHLADEVRTALALSGVDPHQLMLEVTESVLMEDPDPGHPGPLRAPLSRHPDRGGRLRNRLLVPQPPPAVPGRRAQDRQVLHRSARPARRPDSSALVTAIIGLAGTLGLEVIAEGIEHQSQLHRLVELGCHRGQGFLMARPLGQEDAVTFVTEYAGSVTTG